MIKKSFDVGLDHVAITAKEQLSGEGCDRILRPDPQPVAKTAGQKILFTDGLQKTSYSALNQLIFDGGDMSSASSAFSAVSDQQN